MITMTPVAVEKVKGFLTEDPEAAGKVLRIFVEGGGCSGFQYGLSFDEKRDGDEEIAFDGFKVVVDPMSQMYLKGIEVDYVDGMHGAGFKIQNPNASGSCGCGKSFSV